MPYSDRATENYIKNYIINKFNNQIKILDVGPGAGSNYEMLKQNFKNIDCVEIFEPYVERFKLKDKYKNVYICNILDFENFDEYDLIIMGDVLEHLTVEDSKKILDKIYKSKSDLIVQVPYQYKQGISENNIHEIHIQDDLTKQIMKERYGNYLKLLQIHSYLGVYIKGVESV